MGLYPSFPEILLSLFSTCLSKTFMHAGPSALTYVTFSHCVNSTLTDSLESAQRSLPG